MRKAALLFAAVAAAFAGVATAHASSLVPMGEEMASSRLAGIEPGDHAAPAARLGPPAAPAAAQRAADACPEAAPVSHEAAVAPSTPDAGVEIRGPRVERGAGKPAWRWKALLPGALK